MQRLHLAHHFWYFSFRCLFKVYPDFLKNTPWFTLWWMLIFREYVLYIPMRTLPSNATLCRLYPAMLISKTVYWRKFRASKLFIFEQIMLWIYGIYNCRLSYLWHWNQNEKDIDIYVYDIFNIYIYMYILIASTIFVERSLLAVTIPCLHL